jgi:hypothetical protein
VFDITVEDWYGKEDYQLIITGDDKKQYFVDVSVPIQITDVQSKSGVPAASVPTAPTAPTAQPKKPIQPTNATVKPVVTKAPVTDLEKAITK